MLNQIDPKSGGTSPGDTLEAIEQWHIALSAVINHIWTHWDDPEELMYVKLYPEYYLAAFGFNPQIPSYKTKIKFVFDTDDQVTYSHNQEVVTSHKSASEEDSTSDKSLPTSQKIQSPPDSEATTNAHIVKDFKFIEPLNPEDVKYSSSLATKIVTIKQIRKSLELYTLKYFGRRSSNDDFITFWSDVNGGKFSNEDGLEDLKIKELSDTAKEFDAESLGDLMNIGKALSISLQVAELENPSVLADLKEISRLLKKNTLKKEDFQKIEDLTLQVIKVISFSLPKEVEKKLRGFIKDFLFPSTDKKTFVKAVEKYLARVLQFLEGVYSDQKLIILEQFSRSLKERGETIKLKLQWPEGTKIKEQQKQIPVEVQAVLKKIQAPTEEDEHVLFTLKGHFIPKNHKPGSKHTLTNDSESVLDKMQDNLEITLKPIVEKKPFTQDGGKAVKDPLKFDGTVKNFLSGETYGELALQCPFEDYARLFNLRNRTNGWKYEDLSSLAGVMVVVIPPKPAEDDDMPSALEDYMSICRNQPFTCS
ncbi:hypothetical protein BKI52_39965 [marine bacterium AO1-C]|nr:hypothetical protein BKI52_39965 [marine bacterium AO1-C]